MGNKTSRLTVSGKPYEAGEVPYFFDPYYYRQFCPEMRDDRALYDHYVTIGWRRGLSPSPYFLVPWYLSEYEDVLRADREPLEHFLVSGLKEQRSPHPAFDLLWYQRQVLSDADYEGDPVRHYLSIGWARGYKTHPLFWTAWYAEKYLKDRPEVDPFYHYYTEGWRRGLQPNPLFDGNWYLRQASEAGYAPKLEPLADYIHGGHRRLDPHPLFKTAYFQAQGDAKSAAPEKSALEIYLTEKPHINPTPLFDQAFFLRKIEATEQPEAIRSQAPLVRYLEQRPEAGFDPHPFFSRQTYRMHAPDVAKAGSDPLLHYVVHGFKEHRRFHPLFEAPYYAKQQGEGFVEEPLQHYLLHGQHEGLSPRAPKTPDQVTRLLPSGRKVLEVSAQTIPDAESLRFLDDTVTIGVFIHIFHTDLIREMLFYANNVPAGRSTFYITTDTPAKAREIVALCRSMSRHPFEVRVVENRGRDIAPFLVGFADRLQDVTYGVHIHTKKSSHYGREFDSWRRHLLSETLGTSTLVLNLLALLAQDGIGLVAPDHFGPIKRLIQWGGNLGMVTGLLELMGEHLTNDHILDFPSGSMFWFRTDALRKLTALNLQNYHFEAEAGQYDGTLAHAIERGLFYFVEAAGYRWIVTHTSKSKSAAAERLRSRRSSAALAHGNRIFPTDRELGPVRKYYAECTRCVATASEIQKPRINLLVPTADPSRSYAGIVTAFDMFVALREVLGTSFDARIIATDISPGLQYSPPYGYVLASSCEADVAGRDVVENAALRFAYPIGFRDNDILIATAWWTAGLALECLAHQDRLFGARPRKMVYFIQDFEPGFYANSTKSVLAEQTYLRRDRTVPVYNTRYLAEFFRAAGYFDEGLVLEPSISREFADAIERNATKERIVLLYARPHAERNCLPFLDMLVTKLLADDPAFWAGWRFCAIGEDFSSAVLQRDSGIEILGRLSMQNYADLASRAALAVSLMVSPHPSYPPLEMAEAGVLVLTNTHGSRDLSKLHQNISTFGSFDVDSVAEQVCKLARNWGSDPQAGWNGKPLADWFFGGRSNMPSLCQDLGEIIRALAGVSAKPVPRVSGRAPNVPPGKKRRLDNDAPAAISAS